MAILGTVVLEDITINFTITADNKALVFVSEALHGESESYTCEAPAFFAALGLALQFDHDSQEFAALSEVVSLSDIVYSEVEQHQPKNPALRWIP